MFNLGSGDDGSVKGGIIDTARRITGKAIPAVVGPPGRRSLRADRSPTTRAAEMSMGWKRRGMDEIIADTGPGTRPPQQLRKPSIPQAAGGALRFPGP